MTPAAIAGRGLAARHRQASWWRRERAHLLAIAPAALLLGLFFIFPAMWAVYASLTNIALLDFNASNPEFIGLDNYRRLWNDPDFPKYLRNTAVFVFGAAVLGQTGAGLGLALL